MKKLFIVLALALVLPACTWVKLNPEAEQVVVVQAQHVTKCKLLGKTTVSVRAKVAGVERKDDPIASELEILARNQAAAIQGDSVVATSDIKDGQQSFNIYRCKP